MPEADEGLDMGGKRYVKTLLEHVTGGRTVISAGSPETNFMRGRYGNMTPGFEIALAIGPIVGFALGLAFARSFPIDVIRQRGDGTFSNPGDVGGVNRANGGAAGYMTISPGEEAEARGREPWENRLS